ncbi:TPA: hypothetical protein ACX3A9_003573 [Vibrio parahaemolyticus]|uniref:hypothetical protein n=1 Tax=Vibrio parahaemolyticus TaxID=670 RepID=UPI0015DEA797|nr:hypothetical protein [Vibrio parahaemolyticus]
MHLVCKFIPSSKLSSNELSYVLTPDECIGQLSRVRNSEDILRNLPKELAQKISISAKKSSSRLLTAIRHELGNGNWVALSSFSRRTPLTDTQLQSFPRLKAQLESVSSTGESKVYKAGYKQVKDDVTLVRSYTHVPSEPNPDQKIVVEFAGQWSSNAACLMLGKTEAQKEKVTVGKADTENKHRSLATFKDLEAEGKTLYIKIPCSDQPQPILLKLAEDLQPVDKETQMDEWDNVLVPVVPLHFPGSDKSDEAAEVFKSGYVYVVWNNKIWREVAITENGYFSDTDINSVREGSRPKRHADIYMTNPETGGVFAYEPFQIVQNGKVVSEGSLNGSGEARVFNLVEEEVEIVMTGYEPQIKEKIETNLSPINASSPVGRSAQGYPLPHIWLPYKIKGEPQEVYLAYNSKRLSESELSELESDPGTKAIKVTDLNHYSSEKSFKMGDGSVRLLSVLPSAATSKPEKYAMLRSQINKNVAVVYLLKSVEIVFEYPGYTTLDESDDYFELRQSDGDWSQRVCLRQCIKKENGSRLIRFTGWPAEVKEVDLLRGYQGNSHHGRDNKTVIFAQTPIADLLAYKKKDQPS